MAIIKVATVTLFGNIGFHLWPMISWSRTFDQVYSMKNEIPLLEQASCLLVILSIREDKKENPNDLDMNIARLADGNCRPA